MKLQKHCYHCLYEFSHKIANLATGDEKIRRNAVNQAVAILESEFSLDNASLGLAAKIFHTIREITGNNDPYNEIKKEEIAIGRAVYQEIKSRYTPCLADSLKMAAAGNSLDFFKPIEGVKQDMQRDVHFTIDDSETLGEKIKNSRNILYLADNAGETFFDMPLLKLMRKNAEVSYVIKPSPIQNDVTLDDIRYAELLDEAGNIMTTGTATAGVVFSMASSEFISKFNKADLIFAKGMGYYEALSELPGDRRIFYCLKAKCQPVADSLNVPLDSYIAMFN